MGVLAIIAFIFVESLISLLGLVGFAFLLIEFLRRRARHLLLAALLHFSLFAGYGCLFLGQVFQLYGRGDVARYLVSTSPFFAIIDAAIVFAMLIEIYGGSFRWFWRFLVAIPVAASLFAAVTEPVGMLVMHGLAFPGIGAGTFIRQFGVWALAITLLLAVPKFATARAPKAKPQSGELMLRRAGIFGILMFVANGAYLFTGEMWLMVIAVIMHGTYFFQLFFAAASIDNPDPSVNARPTVFLTRRLSHKAAALNIAIFWALTFFLLSLTSTYFVRSGTETRVQSMRRDVHNFSRSYSGFARLFLEETTRLAELPSIEGLMAQGGEIAPDVREFIDRHDGGGRILRIVGSDGRVLFSSYRADEVGTSLVDSVAVRSALDGKRLAVTELDEALNQWTIRAAIPFTLSDGTPAGVVLATDIGPALNFRDYTDVSPISASGYGFVSEDGRFVYRLGDEIDELTKSTFRKTMNGTNLASGQLDGLYYAVERVRAFDGRPDGWFYVFMTEALMETDILRILIVVLIAAILALIGMTAVLVFSVTFVLQPISRLHSAARRIEGGDYSARVDHAAPDELGDLAAAFNRMGTTIGERTKSLKVALEEERDFLTNTALELRAPLNIFRWTLEMMRYGDTGRLTREQLELLEQLHQTTQRMTAFSQNLLDASLIAKGKAPLRRDTVSISDVVDEVAGAMSIRVRGKNINLHWNRPQKPVPAVSGDRARILQIVQNLVSNAVKYAPENGHVEIAVAESGTAGPGGRHGKFVKVTVEDNGRGIPHAEQGRVFVPFFRGSNVVKEDIRGIGLGLFITKELVELHGGRIWFKSDEDEGTTFSFTLPVERTNRRAAGEREENGT